MYVDGCGLGGGQDTDADACAGLNFEEDGAELVEVMVERLW